MIESSVDGDLFERFEGTGITGKTEKILKDEKGCTTTSQVDNSVLLIIT